MPNPEILSLWGQGLSFQDLQTSNSPINLCPLWEIRPHLKIRLISAWALFPVSPAARCLPQRRCSGQATCKGWESMALHASLCLSVSFECGVWEVTISILRVLRGVAHNGSAFLQRVQVSQEKVFLCKSSPNWELAYQQGNMALYSTGFAETAPAGEKARTNWTREGEGGQVGMFQQWAKCYQIRFRLLPVPPERENRDLLPTGEQRQHRPNCRPRDATLGEGTKA